MTEEKYVVIKRYGDHLGLFSYVITNIGNINKVIQEGKIPVIDMQTYPNAYLEEGEVGLKNAWEFFFEQPMNISLKDIEGKKWEELTSVPRNRPNDSMSFFLNKKKRDYWKKIAQKYIRLNYGTRKVIEKEERNLFGKDRKDRVLGVLCRGTDYVQLKPFRHPVQPTAEEVIEKAKKVMKRRKCQKLFLATEDEEILKKFQKAFGKKLIYSNQKRFSNTKGSYLSKIHFERKNDAYLKGLEYLTTIILLSKCDCFIAGRTSGTIGAVLFSKGFDYTYFWDKGRYKFFPFFPSVYKQEEF